MEYKSLAHTKWECKYHIVWIPKYRNQNYQKEVHGEIDRCDHLCWLARMTDPAEKEKLVQIGVELFNGTAGKGTFITPPFFIDCASEMHLGENVYINHNFTAMSLGSITIEDGVMVGPGTSILTVNHEPKNIRIVMAKPVVIKKGAWIGGNVRILPGVTIGENAIVGTAAVVTKDVPANTVVVGCPAKVVKEI